MRLSEAIALGRTLVHPVGGVTLTYDGLNGCALGMGFKAAGGKFTTHKIDIPMYFVSDLWPWLKRTDVKSPCHCPGIHTFCAASLIAHLFDAHVMTHSESRKPWTLDQLIDWVRQNEPQEQPEKKSHRATTKEFSEVR